MEICCPACDCTNIKKNGHIHTGKQNHQCNECGRQFVQNSTQKRISDREKELIGRLLLERILYCRFRSETNRPFNYVRVCP